MLSSAKHEEGVNITAEEDGTEFVLISGEPLNQTVVQYGPFVMTSRDDIQRTLMDCKFAESQLMMMALTFFASFIDQMQRNGFEKAQVWKSDIGGLKEL